MTHQDWRPSREKAVRAAYKALGHEESDPWEQAVRRRADLGMTPPHTVTQLAVYAAVDAILALPPGVKLSSEQVRKFAMEHDHLAVPVRPGVTVTWTDEETGEVINRATIKGRNVVPLVALHSELPLPIVGPGSCGKTVLNPKVAGTELDLGAEALAIKQRGRRARRRAQARARAAHPLRPPPA
jgi:hypothetical protein